MSVTALFFLLAAGFVVLLITADLLVRGAAALALRFGLPRLFVGLTIVAFGTSAPELVVSVDAVLEGAPEAALGNVVGSNIANVLLVLGVPALLFGAISTTTPGLRRNAIASFAAVTVLLVLCLVGPLGFASGAILFGLMAAYLVWLYFEARKPDVKDPVLAELTEELDEVPQRKMGLIAVMIVAGLIGLPIGAALIVKSGVAIATTFGVPTHIIGLTLLALGTSLPELAAGVMAAARGHGGEVAIGNVLGSNLFNSLGVMGVTAMVGTVPVPDSVLGVDLWVMIGAMGLLTALILARKAVGRLLGLLLIGGYGAYIAWLGYSMTL